MFAIIAIPFAAFQQLPEAEDRWLVTCLARYVDRLGECCPSLRQLVRDSRMSLAAVSRRLAAMGQLGVFQRERKPGQRYHYRLAEGFRPRWPGRVPRAEQGVPQAGTQEAELTKYAKEALTRRRFVKSEDVAAPDWAMRLRCWQKSRFWQPFWGPRPNQAGCFAPVDLLPGPAAAA